MSTEKTGLYVRLPKALKRKLDLEAKRDGFTLAAKTNVILKEYFANASYKTKPKRSNREAAGTKA